MMTLVSFRQFVNFCTYAPCVSSTLQLRPIINVLFPELYRMILKKKLKIKTYIIMYTSKNIGRFIRDL